MLIPTLPSPLRVTGVVNEIQPASVAAVHEQALGADTVSFCGTPPRLTGRPLASGADTPVSIRQQNIRLLAREPDAKDNTVTGTVVRQVFLGSNRDYMIEVADGTQLRVITPANESVAQGSTVWLHLPPERCRALSR